jgi:hypothetical protein
VAKIVAAQPPYIMTHERSRLTYLGVRLREPQGTKQQIVGFRRFCMGHTIELRGYAKRIVLREDGECRWCGEEDETPDHLVLRCAALAHKRLLLGVNKMADLATKPVAAQKFYDTIVGEL